MVVVVVVVVVVLTVPDSMLGVLPGSFLMFALGFNPWVHHFTRQQLHHHREEQQL